LVKVIYLILKSIKERSAIFMSLYTWLREHTRHFYDLSTTRYNNWTTENNFTNIQYLEEYFYPM